MNIILTNFIFPRLHYLFYGTLALIAGITCQFFGLRFIILLSAALILILAGYTYRIRMGYSHALFLIIPISFLVGSMLCFFQQKKTLDFYAMVAHKKLTAKGSISSIEIIHNPRFKFVLHLDVSSITIDSAVHRCDAKIALYIHSMPDLAVGDSVEIKNITFKNIPQSSFAHYLAKEKISATLFIETLDFSLVARPSFNLARSLFTLKQSLFYKLQKKINRETFQLFSSIFLGNRTAVKKQMDATKEPFKIWGTSHYLARSGLHLVIFVIIWHFMLSLMPFSYLFKELFLIFLILTYAMLSWSSVSFERALLMVLIYKLCTLSRSPSHYIHLIIFVTALVLCNNPFQLFFLDFQLSFGLTFALAWFNHIQAHKKLLYS